LKGATVEIKELLRKLEAMLHEAHSMRMWGKIELEIRDGDPAVLRKLTTENLKGQRDTTHADKFQR
jgi:hypothetical protein